MDTYEMLDRAWNDLTDKEKQQVMNAHNLSKIDDKKKIIEKNEKIAKFMGGTRGTEYESTADLWFFNNPDEPIKYLKYNVSWERLMPVVHKIEKVVSDHKDVGNLLSPWTHWYNQFNGTVNTDIEVTYLVVLEFIEWFTSQNLTVDDNANN